jgi:hypothetical protein
MSSAGFEPAIPAIERSQNYVLDRTATGIGCSIIWVVLCLRSPFGYMSREIILLAVKVSDLVTSTFMTANKQTFHQVIAASSTQHSYILLHEVKEREEL